MKNLSKLGPVARGEEENAAIDEAGFVRTGGAALQWSHPQTRQSIWFDPSSKRCWVLFPGGTDQPRRFGSLASLLKVLS